MTSNSTAISTITKNPVVTGGASEVFSMVAGTTVGNITVQGRSLGSTTLTVQAAGYNDATVTVNVRPSGFAIFTSSFTTTANAANTALSISSGVLDQTTLNFSVQQAVRGGASASVPVSSSNTAVGTIVGNATFTSNQSNSTTAAFDSMMTGMTTLTLGNPGGNFSVASNFQSITANVTP